MATGRNNDTDVLVSYIPADKGRMDDVDVLVSYIPIDLGRMDDMLVLVSYVIDYPGGDGPTQQGQDTQPSNKLQGYPRQGGM